MEYIIPVLIGLLLAVFHVLFLIVMISGIKKMIVCTQKTDALVKSVTEEVDDYKDSQTGKVKYRYRYIVTFKYDHNGQTYESSHTYSDHCRYVRNSTAIIKINPHKPEESRTKDELTDLIKVSLIIPIFVIVDLFYFMCVFSA